MADEKGYPEDSLASCTVRGYPITLVAEQDIMMPITAKVLGVDTRGSALTLWLWGDVHPSIPRSPRTLYMVAADQPAPLHDGRCRYVQMFTVQGATYQLFEEVQT